MNSIIYYFTGTGNSFAAARDISEKINGKLISIPPMMKYKKIKTKADVLGIVFPDYHSGIPNIVRRFILKLENIKNKYIFSVCTYGGRPGLSVKYLARLIESRGGKLSSGFSVKMPYSYIIPSFNLKKFSISIILKKVAEYNQRGMFENWKKKLAVICDHVNSKKTGLYETGSGIILRLVDFLGIRESLGKKMWLKMSGFRGRTNYSFFESIRLMDHGFKADEKCSGCGICRKICSVSNIKIRNKKPLWLHHCEQCFACLQWCPKEAIQFGDNTAGCPRYHHPYVKIDDMIRQASLKTKI